MKTDTKKPCFVRKYTSSNEIPKLTVNEPDRILVYSGKKKTTMQHSTQKYIDVLTILDEEEKGNSNFYHLMQIRVPKMIVTFRIIICFVALFMLFFYITATRWLLLFTV